MNILHIGLVDAKSNGVGQVITYLTVAQRKMGHSVLACTAVEKKEELPFFKEIHSVAELSDIVNYKKPDITIFHSLYVWEYIKFYKFLKKRRIPYLIELHGALSRENYKKSHYKKIIANTLFYKKFIKSAEAIIYLNKGEYANSIVPKINSKGVIVPNGCVPISKSEVFPINEKIEILFLGRIDLYHKGLGPLLEAIQILKTSGLDKNIHFSFYGTGHPNEVESFTESLKSLKGFADFYGPAYGKIKDSVFRSCHIFILTSRSEGMPMAVLESLSYGIPCIVTPQTNVADIMDSFNCGWCTELNPDAIAHTIIKALSDYKSRQVVYRDNALKAAKTFYWDKIAQKTIAIYQNIINNY